LPQDLRRHGSGRGVLVWLWISTLALLFGAKLNAAREFEAGLPAKQQILVEPSNKPKRR
jgi:uncharacterized BrkB/YihY/UPF0761 family membrane protein